MSDESSGRGRSSGGGGVPKEGGPPSGERSPWALAGLGMQFFLALIVFAYAGVWLDRRYNVSPLFLLLGVFVGGGGTFYLTYRSLTGTGGRK